MSIYLQDLGLEYETGELLSIVDKTVSASNYEAIGRGTALKEIYYRETTGKLINDGENALVINYECWIPYNNIKILKTDLLYFRNEKYQIIDVMLHKNNPFEDFYKISISLAND